jgi:hypothetical protein
VCGFNLLLADFPYVLVTIANSTNPSGENRGLLITNNPNAVLSNFICPIANIRNPDIVKFVVVNSSQKMIFKFNPTDNLRFEVNLPNGQLLKYNTTQSVSTCDRAIPLNDDLFSNIKHVYPVNAQNVSAVFSLKLLS